MLQYVCVLLCAVAIHAQTSVNSETDVQSVLNVQVPDPKAVLPDAKSIVAKAAGSAPKATGLLTNVPLASLPNTANLGTLPNPFGAARIPNINAPNIAPLGAPKPANPCDAIICEDKRSCVAQGDRGICVDIKPVTETEATGAAAAVVPKTDLTDVPKAVNQVVGRAPSVDVDAAASAAVAVPKVLASAPKLLPASAPVDVSLPTSVDAALPTPVAPKVLVSKAIESVPLPKPVDGIPQVNVPQTPTVVLTCDKLSCEDGESCEVRRGQAVCVPDVSAEETTPTTPKVTLPSVTPVDPVDVIAKATGVVAPKVNKGGNPCQVTQCAPDRTCVFENGQTACVPKVAVDASASANVKATSS